MRCRNGTVRVVYAFSKCVRLKKYGKKRLVIVHEREDLSDTPRFLLTDAQHWEATRIIQTWSDRWPIETFHQFGKPLAGLESAQVRKEEAVKRHFGLSGVAQSWLMSAPAAGSTSERFSWAQDTPSVGQKLYHIARESVGQLWELARGLFEGGRTTEQVLEAVIPA